MKKLRLVFLSLFIATILIVTACNSAPATPTAPAKPAVPATSAATPAGGAAFDFKLSIPDPPMHQMVNGALNPWIQEVAKRTDNKVKITLYAAETLGKANELYDLVVKGAANIAKLVGTQYPGRFPLADAFNLPYLIPYNEKGTPIREMLYQKYYNPLMFKDVHVLWTHRAEPLVMQMGKKQIKTVDDIKAAIIGIPGGKINSDFIKAFGGSAETTMLYDSYTAMERGMVEGVMVPLECQLSFKLSEVTKSITMINKGAASDGFMINVNDWNKLGPDLQKVFNDLNPLVADLLFKADKGVGQAALANCQKMGIQVIELSPVEMKRFVDGSASIEQQWFAQMDSQGFPGAAMYKDIQAMLK